MNIKDAKSIPLDEFLDRQGYTGKLKAGRLWYAIREESHASFVLTRDRFAWYDHGLGVGGNIIDWPITYKNARDVSASIGYIAGVMGSGYIVQPDRVEFKKMEPELPHYTLVSVDDFEPYNRRELTAHAKHLASRGINPERAAPYLTDIKFTLREDPKSLLYGFGMINEQEGYEVRSKLFPTSGYKKTTVGGKGVSVIRARNSDRKTEDWHTKPWLAFYSMMDFLTFITTDHSEIGTYNFIVMHGDAMIHKAAEYLNTLLAGTIHHYCHLDSNGNGQRAMLDLMGEMPDWKHGDMSYQYDEFKDMNEKHMYELKLEYRPAEGNTHRSFRNIQKSKPRSKKV